MERAIKFKRIYTDKKKWTKDISDIIYQLRFGYNFYYTQGPIINRDILEVIYKNGKKHFHKIILYWNSDRDNYFLVVYKKKEIDIYKLTDDYSISNNPTTRYKGAKYFMKKFYESYEKAGTAKQEQEFNEIQQLQAKEHNDPGSK